jgi:large subunit ribosomal protein L18
MKELAKKLLNRTLRQKRVRARVFGTGSRPRLVVFISNTHVSAQIIDDEKRHTLVSATTVGSKQKGSMKEKSAWIGEQIAGKAKKAKLHKVVFDRHGRQYAGRLQALADAARKEGLEF